MDWAGITDAPRYGPRPQYPIESVDNALKVILLLAQRPSLRMTDVSEYLGVASSSAHRLLAMLQYRGIVRQNPGSRTYIAGPALDDLAFGALGRLDVRSQARPVMARLNEVLQEKPGTINKGPETKGWIAKIALSEQGRDDFGGLMDAEAYGKFVEE